MSLLEAGYTDEWILGMLQESNPRFLEAKGESRVVKLESSHISGGKGFLSLVFRVFVHFDADRPPYSFIMKVPSLKTMDDACDKTEMDPVEKENFHNALVHSHNVECDAYELMRDIGDFPLAEVYFIQHNTPDAAGLLVMEDLCDKTESLALNVSPTRAHCLNIARHIAAFQTFVNLLPGQPWRGKFGSRANFHVDRGNVDQWDKYFRKLTEIEPKFNKPGEAMLGLRYMDFCEYALLKRPEEFGATTLWHGDTWVNNVRMKKNPDGSISSEIAAFLDWQIVCEGSPLLDVARFLVYCVDAEIRREIEVEMVDHFYRSLVEMHAARGQTAHELYELAAIHQTYEFVYFSYFICAQNRENGDRVHEAMAAKLLLRCLFAAFDSADRLQKLGLVEKFKQQGESA